MAKKQKTRPYIKLAMIKKYRAFLLRVFPENRLCCRLDGIFIYFDQINAVGGSSFSERS